MASSSHGPDFSAYLHVSMDDIPETTPTLPGGHYFATITTWKTAERDFDKATGGAKTPVVEISFRITGADDDIEADDLPPGGGVGKLVTRDYRLNDGDKAGLTQLRRLATVTCQLDTKGLELPDVLDLLKGQEVKVYNVPRPGRNEGEFFANITQVLPANG